MHIQKSLKAYLILLCERVIFSNGEHFDMSNYTRLSFSLSVDVPFTSTDTTLAHTLFCSQPPKKKKPGEISVTHVNRTYLCAHKYVYFIYNIHVCVRTRKERICNQYCAAKYVFLFAMLTFYD